MTRRNILVITFAALVVAAAGLTSCASTQNSAGGPATTTVYVNAGTGNDSNNCSVATPCRTIQHAIDQAVAPAVVSIAGGDYPGGLNLNKDGITLQGAPGPRPNVVLPDGIVNGVGNVYVTASNIGIDHLHIQKTDTASATALINEPVIPASGGKPASLHTSLTLNDLLADGAYFGAWLNTLDLKVTNSTWINQNSDSVWVRTSQGSAVISGNTFTGGRKKAISYEPKTDSLATTGTISVTNNVLNGKTNFFVFSQWVDSKTAPKVAIDVSSNRLQGLTSSAIAVWDASPAGTFDHTHISSFTAHFNQIYPIASGLFAIRNDMTGGTAKPDVPIAGQNNWFGCNLGPTDSACSHVDATVTANPWLTLGLAAKSSSVGVKQTVGLSATLTKNSAGQDTSSQGHVPDGASIGLSADKGTVGTPVTTVNGVASATFTAPDVPADVTITAKLDAAGVSIPIKVTSAVPSAPQNVTAVSGAKSTITVTWVAPASPGSSPITSYKATAVDNGGKNSGSCTAAGDALTCTITGIKGGGPEYDVTVTATNASGTGPPSAPVKVTPK